MDSTRNDRSKGPGPTTGNGATVLDAVADAVSRLKYGVVELTVHDGRVVQLDVTERRRFS